MQKLTLHEKYARIERATQYPAMFLAPLIRYDIGPRALNPGSLGILAFLLFLLGIWATKYPPPVHGEHLALFAVLAYAEAIRQRANQMRAFDRNNVLAQHSWFVGHSFLHKIWLPQFLKRNRRVERFIDGPLCMLLGWIVFPYSGLLGIWLIFSGACLREFEHALFKQQKQQRLDLWDAVVVAEIHSQIVEQFQRPNQPANQQAAPQIIQTGVDPVLRQKINQQQRKQPQLPPKWRKAK